jgi:WD40 repeat protein
MSVLKWLCVLLLLVTTSVALAQEDIPARVIETPYGGAEFALSADRRTLAVYQVAVLVNDEPSNPLYLPILIYDAQTGERIDILGGFIDYTSDAAFSPDGAQFASFHTNGDLLFWDTATWTLTRRLETTLLGGGRIEYMPDGKRLMMLTPGQPSRFLLWDINTGFITGILGERFGSMYQFRETALMAPGMFDHNYTAFAIAPDGQTMAVATGNDEVLLWDIASNEHSTLREPPEEYGTFSIRSMAFTPDKRFLIHGSMERLVVWDVAAQTEAFTFDGRVTSVAVSPEGDQIAWMERLEGGTRVFASPFPDFAPTEVTTFNVQHLPTVSLAFIPDGLVIGGFGDNVSESFILILDRP